jgi:hypothetical protein
MNMWPKNTLRHWMHEAGEGRCVMARIELKTTRCKRLVEGLEVSGYELWRVYRFVCGQSSSLFSRASVVVDGFADDPPQVIKANVDAGNEEIDRDEQRLRAAGVDVNAKARFSSEEVMTALSEDVAVGRSLQ